MNLNCFEAVVSADHNHEYLFPTLRIAHITEGEFDWQIGSNTYSMKTGDIVLLNNLLPRKIINQTLPLSRIDVFEFLPMELQKRPLLVQAFYGETPNIIFHEKGKPICDLLLTMSSVYESIKNQAFYEHIMQAVFDLFEDMFCQSPPHTSCLEAAFRAANFIWDNFAEDINVTSVAAHLHISKNQLEKTFKQMHGICVGGYIRSIRIYNVMKLLKCDSERSVLDIALSCGFKSSSGFYKTYKTLVCSTPKNSRFS